VWSAKSALLLMAQALNPATGRAVRTSHGSGRFAASSMASLSKLSAIDDQSGPKSRIPERRYDGGEANRTNNVRLVPGTDS